MEDGFGRPTCFRTEYGETSLSNAVSVRLYVTHYKWVLTPRHPNPSGGYSQLFGIKKGLSQKPSCYFLDSQKWGKTSKKCLTFDDKNQKLIKIPFKIECQVGNRKGLSDFLDSPFSYFD